MKTNDVLGGFDAIFDTLSPNENAKFKGVEIVEDPNDRTNDTVEVESDLTEDDDVVEITPVATDDSKGDPSGEPGTPGVDGIPVEVESHEDDAEIEQVTAFFDAIAEQVGWEGVTDDDKPKSVEDFVNYMKTAVEESSKPVYANDEVAAIDEYVRNGGTLSDYVAKSNVDVDYDKLDLTDEYTQKEVVRQFLTDKGFSDIQIKRKLEKYEDADLLEDEATDAVEFLKESKEQKKKELLENQRMAYETSMQEQQKFYNNVVEQIEALTDVRGIKIPKEDKSILKNYLLKVESDGSTKYQKDYSNPSKIVKNLIESAYFTMKGDVLLEQAKRSGETSATERLKNTLRTNKVSGSKQTINNGSAMPLWTMAANQLRAK
jgi:hypothetical protein